MKYRKQISEDGSPIALIGDSDYFVIDTLYLDDVRASSLDIDFTDFIEEIRRKVFIYCYFPAAAMHSPIDGCFRIEWIKYFEYDSSEQQQSECFDTDSGTLILVKADILKEVTAAFYSDKIWDPMAYQLNETYIDELLGQFEIGSIGIIVSPGCDSGFDLIGSGTYRVQVP